MNKNKKVFMWYKVKQLSETGLNKSQISRELGLDRGTVRKYLAIDETSFMSWINNPRHLPKKLSRYYQYVKDTHNFLKIILISILQKQYIKIIKCPYITKRHSSTRFFSSFS